MGVRCNAEQPKSSATIQQSERKIRDLDLSVRQAVILSLQAFTDSEVQRFTGSRFRVQGSRFRVQSSRFRVPFFALRAMQGKQGSAQLSAKKTAGQIEQETLKKRISNKEYRILLRRTSVEVRNSVGFKND